jgi:hypothetical protein
VVVIAAPCAAQPWWWPPTGGLQVMPECLSATTTISLRVSGQWPDSCIPNASSAQVDGSNIELTTMREPPPGFCLSVISNWSRTETVGPLAPGTYSVFVTHRVSGQVVHPRTQIGSITVVASCGTSCYANCDLSTGSPILTANDFQCFIDAFAAGSSYANCDNSIPPPVLTANDFQCFLNAYAAGCS